MKTSMQGSSIERSRCAGTLCVIGSTVALLLVLAAYLTGETPARAEGTTSQPKDPTIMEPPRQPTATEILNELMKRQSARPAIMPSRPGAKTDEPPASATEPAVSPSRQELPLLPDGTTIADRVGRLVRRNNVWLFAFESEGKVLREAPMQILPNRDLETMEALSAGGTRPVRFRVSGEVTEYRSTNYLLLRKVLTVHDMGNLK